MPFSESGVAAMPTSMRSCLRASIMSSVLSSSIFSLISGYFCENSGMNLGKREGATVGMTARLSSPSNLPPIFLAICSNTWASYSTERACSRILAPSGVGTMGCLDLSKIRMSNSSSSFCNCILNVGCVTKQASAALAKWRWLSTATMYLS